MTLRHGERLFFCLIWAIFLLGYGSLFFLLAGLFVHGYQEDAFSMMYINAGMTPCSQILQNNEEDFMASMGVIFSIIDWVKLAQFCNFCKVSPTTELYPFFIAMISSWILAFLQAAIISWILVKRNYVIYTKKYFANPAEYVNFKKTSIDYTLINCKNAVAVIFLLWIY